MKKFFAVLMTVAAMSNVFNITASGATDTSVNVYVTISDKDGDLVLTQEKINVTDVDNDGALTINDALYVAHEVKYEGGAEAGYESAYSAYGLSLNKLWGTSNGGSYGYYVNNKSAWSLTDTVEEGDYVNAYIYTDLTTWSDKYCYFAANTTTVKAGEEINLTLLAAGYDADYNPIEVPVEGAVITVNGEKTEYTTDKDGKTTITIRTEGSYVISAVSDTLTLVPPACKASILVNDEVNTTVNTGENTTVNNEQDTVADNEQNTTANTKSDTTVSNENNTTITAEQNATSPKTGDSVNYAIFVVLLSLSGIVILSAKGKEQSLDK